MRDPFEGHSTFVWMRFHHSTPGFSIVQNLLKKSKFSTQIVRSSENIWIPFGIPLNTCGESLIDSFVEQAEEIVQVAYEPLS